MATLPPETLGVIRQALSGLDRRQLDWLAGYIAALAEVAEPAKSAKSGSSVSAQPSALAAGPKLTVMYASQTGNGKVLAEKLYQQAQQAGLESELVSAAEFKPSRLKQLEQLALVASTHGEGDPPDDALDLHALLGGRKAPKLDQLQFAVLALGDSSYEKFCQTGRDFDELLAKQGAERLLARVDCDVDFEQAADEWIQALLEKLKQAAPALAPVTSVAPPASQPVASWSKKQPFAATVLANQKITGRDSDRDIRHIELTLEESGLSYQPGDSLGIWPRNKTTLVDEVLDITGNAEPAGNTDLRDALTNRFELTLLHPGFITGLAEQASYDELRAIAADKTRVREYIAQRQIIDVLREFPTRLSAEQLKGLLRPLTPRLYSIASAQAEVEDEVHITVGVVRYQAFDQEHVGAASGFLADDIAEGDQVDVFVEPNSHFRLPEQADTPMIMIGPGTGIAPFRSFMQQREADSASGDNWLFFGNPHFTQDFLYQSEWQQWQRSGLLSRVDLAFSRDQENKIYVQHRLQQQGADIWHWLKERGAYLYVCGDASRMAKDVQQALLDIFREHGGLSQEAAKEFLAELRRAKRYQRDVY